ncbi:MAG: helix-turn-helix transcriptional regulator [Clostridia bacterium]|nr:helix-turn-helix transcriptional regulator [Clostridia bacterium]
MDYVDLGKRVRARRTALNWTQEHLAQEIGVSTSFIGHIERGSRKASIDTLVMLANAMKISTDELLGGSLSMPNDLVMPVKNLTKGQKQAMMQILTTAQEQVLQWNTPDE